jgi:hypothetical protein
MNRSAQLRAIAFALASIGVISITACMAESDAENEELVAEAQGAETVGLGHASSLGASASNRVIKKREPFRPFAPVVLKDKADRAHRRQKLRGPRSRCDSTRLRARRRERRPPCRARVAADGPPRGSGHKRARPDQGL